MGTKVKYNGTEWDVYSDINAPNVLIGRQDSTQQWIPKSELTLVEDKATLDNEKENDVQKTTATKRRANRSSRTTGTPEAK